MSEAAAIAFDRVVDLVLCGALDPPAATPDQAAAERSRRLREERLQLLDRLRAADVVVPKQACIFELRAAAAAIGKPAINRPADAAQASRKNHHDL